MQTGQISAAQKLRSFGFQLWFWLYTIPMGLLLLPTLVLPRIAIYFGNLWWCQLTLWGLRVFAGVRYEVRGLENLPAEPCLIASKHQSMWETMAFNVILKDPAIVIKRELASIPFYGWFVQKHGSIVVDRDAHASALKRMIADAKDRFSQGRPVVIFPEGTRKRPDEPADYKPGVAALYGLLGVPCVPIALNSGQHWINGTPWRRSGTILVQILPPIPPGLKRQAFMTELETRIETAMAALPGAPANETETRAA